MIKFTKGYQHRGWCINKERAVEKVINDYTTWKSYEDFIESYEYTDMWQDGTYSIIKRFDKYNYGVYTPRHKIEKKINPLAENEHYELQYMFEL